MATPTGITLPPYALIIEMGNETGPNVRSAGSSTFSGGYVRQMGGMVSAANIDDFVQFDSEGAVEFIQDSVTYNFVQEDKVFFIQEIVIPP